MATPRKQQSMNWTTELRLVVQAVERDNQAHVSILLPYHRSGHHAYTPYIDVTVSWLQARVDAERSHTVKVPRDARRWPVLEAQLISCIYTALEGLKSSIFDPGRVKPLFPDWHPELQH